MATPATDEQRREPGQGSRSLERDLTTAYVATLKHEMRQTAQRRHHGLELRSLCRLADLLLESGVLMLDGLDPEHTHVWADLHLDDRLVTAYRLGIGTVQRLHDRVFTAWERLEPDDTLLTLGDVQGTALVRDKTKRRIGQMTAEHILVAGNHDVDTEKRPDPELYGMVVAAAVIDGDPPLLCTHLPLREVPEGCVNVHGHLHGRINRLRFDRRINVEAELLRYEPASLELLRRLARRALAGTLPVTTRDTRARLYAVSDTGTDPETDGSMRRPLGHLWE